MGIDSLLCVSKALSINLPKQYHKFILFKLKPQPHGAYLYQNLRLSSYNKKTASNFHRPRKIVFAHKYIKSKKNFIKQVGVVVQIYQSSIYLNYVVILIGNNV